MSRTSLLAMLALAAVAACSKEEEKKPEPAPAAAPAPAPAPKGPQAIATVLYKWPKDTAAFEQYYVGHLKLLEKGLTPIGFTKAELTRFTASLDGKKPAFYRQAELYFADMDALRKGLATPEFKAVGDDLKNFATGGLVALIAVETGEKGEVECPHLVTVIYNTPKDTAAFEQYYPTHLAIVNREKAGIGFVRADLTRFVSNLDGSTPASHYRQAELCFESAEALTKGIATAGFKAVGDDFKNFVTNGLTGMVGHKTN